MYGIGPRGRVLIMLSSCGSLKHRVLVVTYGGDHGYNAARRLLECGVLPYLVDSAEFDVRQVTHCQPRAVVLSACNLGLWPTADSRIFFSGVPILGICNGHQLIATAMGSEVVPLVARESGRVPLTVHRSGQLLKGLSSHAVTMWHDYQVEVPPNFVCLASTQFTAVAAMECVPMSLFGVQFHPEGDEAGGAGREVFANFLRAAGIPVRPMLQRVGRRLLFVGERLERLRSGSRTA